MIEYYEISGHAIALPLIEMQPHCYRWVWHIDGRHPAKGPGTLAALDAARSDALCQARLAVERLERGRVEAVEPARRGAPS